MTLGERLGDPVEELPQLAHSTLAEPSQSCLMARAKARKPASAFLKRLLRNSKEKSRVVATFASHRQQRHRGVTDVVGKQRLELLRQHQLLQLDVGLGQRR